MADTRPTPIQYVAYVYGRRLPDSMRSWWPMIWPGQEPSVGT